MLGVACHILLLNLLLAQQHQRMLDGTSIDTARATMLPLRVHEWVRIDSARIFVGSRLYDLIDGGADLVLEYGFKSALAATYRDSLAHMMRVELYEMQDSEAAFGLYTSLSAGIGKRANIGSGAAIGNGYIFFWKGAVQGSVTLIEGTPLGGSQLAAFSSEISEQIRDGPGPPPLFGRIYAAGYPPDGVVAIHGALGLMNHSPFRGADSFPVDYGVIGRRDSCGFLILQYKDDLDAREAFRRGTEHLKTADSRSFMQTGNTCTLRQDDGNLVTIKLTDRWIIGLTEHNRTSNPGSMELLESLVPR